MPAMKDDAADKSPHEGHDMPAMKKGGADKSPHEGHDMSAMKDGGDKVGMPMPAQNESNEEHLMGVVTRVEPTALTLILERGSSAVILIDGKTAYKRGETKTTSKGIKVGERIVIYASPRNGKWLARVVKLAVAASNDKADAGTPSPTPEHGLSAQDPKNPPQVQEFSCPMHPEVRSPTAGRCPKCGMKLQPVTGK